MKRSSRLRPAIVSCPSTARVGRSLATPSSLITCAGPALVTHVRPVNRNALVRAPCSALRSSADSSGVTPAVTAGLDLARTSPQVPPEPEAVGEVVVERTVVVAAGVEAPAAALVEVLVDELTAFALPQAPTPAARARQDRMVTGGRTPGSLARLRAGHRVVSEPRMGALIYIASVPSHDVLIIGAGLAGQRA